MKIKEAAMWKKLTKNGKDYFSISITLEDGTKLNTNVFEARKTKDTQPDYKTIQEKKEQSPEQALFGDSPMFQNNEEVPF